MEITLVVPEDLEGQILQVPNTQAFLEGAVREALKRRDYKELDSVDRSAQIEQSIAFFKGMGKKLADRGGSLSPRLTKEEIYADGGP